LLGGWSLGGLLALEIAGALIGSQFEVLGIIMIDTSFPSAMLDSSVNAAAAQPVWDQRTQPEIRRLILQSMQLAVSMVKKWVPPVWRDCNGMDWNERSAKFSKFVNSRSNSELSCITQMLPDPPQLSQPPRTILLRCDDRAPVTEFDDPSAISRVDVTRHLKQLGWEAYGYDMITDVLGIPGHHFSVFASEYIDIITARIKQACDMLDHRTT